MAATIREHPVTGDPYGITIGQDNAVWFSQVRAGTIGRRSADGLCVEHELPSPSCRPSVLALGKDNAV